MDLWQQGTLVLDDVGSLEVFYFAKPLDFNGQVVNPGFYWRDAAYQRGFGPFPDVYSATKHYAALTKADKQASILSFNPNNVINVDFKNKTRLRF